MYCVLSIQQHWQSCVPWALVDIPVAVLALPVVWAPTEVPWVGVDALATVAVKKATVDNWTSVQHILRNHISNFYLINFSLADLNSHFQTKAPSLESLKLTDTFNKNMHEELVKLVWSYLQGFEAQESLAKRLTSRLSVVVKVFTLVFSLRTLRDSSPSGSLPRVFWTCR